MLLHKDTDLFREVVISTADILKIAVPIVEKDYYVTMILKELSEANIECVFKGVTKTLKRISKNRAVNNDKNYNNSKPIHRNHHNEDPNNNAPVVFLETPTSNEASMNSGANNTNINFNNNPKKLSTDGETISSTIIAVKKKKHNSLQSQDVNKK